MAESCCEKTGYMAVDAVQRERAVNYLGGNILVSAAAGSGKTSALTRRVVNILKSRNADGSFVRMEQLIIVTFTDAATQEMRERIGSALEHELQSAEADKAKTTGLLAAHFKKQLNALGAAQISTIHSLCSRLVRQNFHLLEIDPSARLADEKEFALLQRECLDGLLEEYYRQNDPAFLKCVAWFCGSNDDEALRTAIFRLHGFACNRADKDGWLETLAADFWPSEEDICGSEWGKALCSMLESALKDIDGSWREIAAGFQGNEAYRLMSERAAGEVYCLNEAVSALRTGDYSAARNAVNSLPVLKFTVKGFNKSVKDGRCGEEYELIKKHLEFSRTMLKEYSEYFVLELPELSRRCRAGREMVAVLTEITAAYGRNYSERKRELRVMDFNDLERLALELLQMPEFAVSLELLQNRVVELMTDEYQDTNEVQEKILAMLAGSKVRRFMVGDLKQSIYGFRQADPDIFRRKRDKAAPDFSDTADLLVQLSMNFRSRPEVLAATNFVFKKIMTADCGGENYDDAAMLRCGRTDCHEAVLAADSEYGAELLVIDKDGDADCAAASESGEGEIPAGDSRGKRQAQIIAERLLALRNSGFEVVDKNTRLPRKLEYRDCAVLLRKRALAAEMQQVLRDNGIPAYTALGSSYFDSYEIRMMLALLAVIDNPLQDIKLAAVLHSPLFEYNAEELTELRKISAGSLWSGLKNAASGTGEAGQKAANCIQLINRWRDLCRQLHIHELLQLVYRESGFFDFAGALPAGRSRQANLRLLQERALAYETDNYRGMFRFLKYVEKLKHFDLDFEEARANSAGDDAVQIITVHGSKGLEYPVVFLADAAARFGKSGQRGLFELNKDTGIGIKYVDLDLNAEFETLPQVVTENVNREAEIAEEMRLLYVALTRAREKVIVVAEIDKRSSLDNLMKNIRPGISSMKVRPSAVRSAGSWLVWLLAAIEAEADNCWKVSVVAREKIKIAEPRTESGSFIENIRKAPEPEAAFVRHAEEFISWRYPHVVNGSAPKLTVSELKRQQYAEAVSSENLELFTAKTVFAPGYNKVDPVALGTAYHDVLRRLDLIAGHYCDEINRVLGFLLLNKMIDPETAAALDTGKIEEFMRSGLAEEIRQSKIVRREQPFVLQIDACKFVKSAAENEKILVQGIIDLLYTDETGAVKIVDYKTDRGVNAEELLCRYQLQLELYARAVKEIANLDVTECIIWYIPRAEAITWRYDASKT